LTVKTVLLTRNGPHAHSNPVQKLQWIDPLASETSLRQGHHPVHAERHFEHVTGLKSGNNWEIRPPRSARHLPPFMVALQDFYVDGVCTENLIRVDDVVESLKLAE
jgi:hypothetical protein